MTNKELYAQLCGREESVNLFMQSWWLSAVCAGKDWDVLLSFDEQGEIQAAMPYLIRKRLWFRYIIMPQQTQLAGIWLRPDIADNPAILRHVAAEFDEKLKDMKLAYYCQNYQLNSPMPALMSEFKFKQRERYTYRLDDLSDMDKVIDSFSKNKKRQLQKALQLHLDTDMTDEEFYRFHTQCLSARNRKITYTREFFLVLYRKSQNLGQSRILAIRDADGNVHAAAFVVWDKEQLYYLIPAIDNRYKDSGAGALLALESVKLAKQVSRSFDFEGSMIRGVANHYRQFGTTRHSYCQLSRYYNPLFAVPVFFYRLFHRS